MRILIDENAMRLIYDPKWSKLREKLQNMGYKLIELPDYLRGAKDPVITNEVLNNYDGIITEDTHFVKSNVKPYFNELIRSRKIVLLVQRVPSASQRYEFRVFQYTQSGKREIFRISPRENIW